MFHSKGNPLCNMCFINCTKILAFESTAMFSVIHMQSRIMVERLTVIFLEIIVLRIPS